MSKTVGVILSGCGFMDGAEIHESVCTLLALDRAGARVRCFAPDTEFDVVDHRTGKATGESRNALEESSRIARGEVEDIAGARAEALDAVLLPGGFGAAKVLSNFAEAGDNCAVDEHVARLLREMHAAGKPIGAICIAPAVVARALAKHGPTLTIGDDTDTASAIEKMGCSHTECSTTGFVVDDVHRIVSTPAYMLGPSIKDVEEGIRKTVEAVLGMT
jgi:enhancing lycopene biosynthesis protein 2